MFVFLTGCSVHITHHPFKMAASGGPLQIYIIIQSPAKLEKATLTTRNPSALHTSFHLICMIHY